MSLDIQEAFRVYIEVPFGKLGSLLDWCERNCTADWNYTEGGKEHWENETMFYGYQFLFESEKDYVAFTMWKK